MRVSTVVTALFVTPLFLNVTGAFANAAGLDPKQIQIVTKTFDFLSKKPAANAKVVVVAGSADIATVKSALPTFTVTEGGLHDVAGAFAVIVNTPDEAKEARGINANVLTIGGDVACVTASACLIAVQVQPKVTIFVSHAAAQAAGIEFDPNFKMLITEK